MKPFALSSKREPKSSPRPVQAHRIDDTDPKRGNVVVRVTGTRHDEPTYQVRQSLPNTQEVPGHDHHTNRVRETGSGSHGPILRSVPTNRLTAPGPILGVPSLAEKQG